MEIHPLVESLFLEWRVKVHTGSPDPKDAGHIVILKEICLANGIDNKVIDNVILALEASKPDKTASTVKKAKAKAEKGETYASVKPDGTLKSKIYTRGKEKGGAVDTADDASGDSDVETQSQEPHVDKMDHSDAVEFVQPKVIEAVKDIEQLMAKGDKKSKIKAAKIAKNLITKYKLSRALYLQDDKEGYGKVYVGDHARYLSGKKEPKKGIGKWIETIESTGVPIPMRPGGMSRTIMSPQQLHRKRVTGTVTEGKDGSRKVTIPARKREDGSEVSERSFVLKADPNDPVSQMRLEGLPVGEVEFCDINDATTPEGRTHCIMNATENLANMLVKINTNLNKKDKFNRKIIKDVTQKLDEIRDLENADPKDTEAFANACNEMLALTKNKNPKFDEKGNRVLNSKGKQVYEQNEFTNMTAYMAETVEAMRNLNEGYETYIPSSGNFKTSDVLALKGGAPTSIVTTVDGKSAPPQEYEMEGSSVKFAGGGASQMPNKVDNSTFKDKDVTIEVNGEKRKGTKEVLHGLMSYYSILYPADGNTPTPISSEDFDKYKTDNEAVFEEFYPESDYPNKQAELDKMWEYCRGKAKTQWERTPKAKRELGESKEDAIRRGQIYHYNQWVTTMVHNHPERGLKSQAFSNSDYVVYDVKGTNQEKKWIKRVHSDGVNSVVWVGFDADQGYSVSDTGYIAPTNVYSSRMKHNNPALGWIKKMK